MKRTVTIRVKKEDIRKERRPSFRPGGAMKSKKDYQRKPKHGHKFD